MTRIALVGSTEEFRDYVEAAYSGGAPVTFEMIPTAGFDPIVVGTIVATEPDVVGIGPDLSDDDSLKIVEEITRTAPHISAVMIAVATPELWPRALRAGARDIVAPLSTGTAIRDSFDRAIEVGRRLRGVGSEPGSNAPGARVLVVVSPKGGSGKTTVAANLAVTVARQRPDDVVLVDFDVQFGDVMHSFRLESEYSLLHAVAPGVTPTMLKGFLTAHPTNVLALAAPDHPEDADDIDPAAATGVVRDLASLFEVVVVDTAAGLDEGTLAVLEAATDVLFVTATDVPSVRAVVKELDILRRLGLLDASRHHLVLNRADARVGLSASDIQETIGLGATLEIPSTRAIPLALNLGEPLVASDERGSVARSFNRFATQAGLIPAAADAGWSWRKNR